MSRLKYSLYELTTDKTQIITIVFDCDRFYEEALVRQEDYEMVSSKRYKLACALIENSDQPAN